MGRSSARSGRRDGEAGASGAIRLDKWIWFARFLRAREACQDLIRKGHVRRDGLRITQPGATVRVGDVLTLALPGRTILVEILALAEKRGGAEEASALYRIIEPPSSPMGKE
jgi:ribosome-associated heat shock protein Hsp15